MKMFRVSKLIVIGLSLSVAVFSQSRWHILPDGGIQWNIAESSLPHQDHIEMSGKKVSVVLRYGVDETGAFQLERSMVWPMLRTIPNNTHASLMQRFALKVPSLLIINGLTIQSEKVSSISLNGKMTVVGQYSIGYVNVGSAKKQPSKPVVEIKTTIFPSTDLALICELYEVKNITEKAISVLVPKHRNQYQTIASKGVLGSYTMVNSIQGDGTFILQPNETVKFSSSIQAFSDLEKEVKADAETELAKRIAFVDEMSRNLVLETPDSVLNTTFKFAKIRATESIFETKGGLMHGPGGESYYAAIWANDQAEYVNPFFPFLGYKTGNESAMNAFKHFARFMNPEYNPIPSSIVAEGDHFWNGVGDRGDAAMIAYGAARYALASGSKEEAKQLWPLIEWCLEYCNRKIDENGVVASNTDELEFRFPAGKANLSTSTLYYDALISASYLGKELGLNSKVIEKYKQQAKVLRTSISSFFSATVEGFETYRYYKENDILRSWICMPLTVGIYDRAKGTIDALFSPRLWTKNGLLTQAGSETFWDRSTLYALRGIFAAGETEKALNYLNYYSTQRLLGEHVPYPIEAWPEGNQRHLAAESGLYCRIITEGMFGIRPTGLKSFSLTPRLPKAWTKMGLKNIKAFGTESDLLVVREKGKIKVTISSNEKVLFSKTIANGSTVNVHLK